MGSQEKTDERPHGVKVHFELGGRQTCDILLGRPCKRTNYWPNDVERSLLASSEDGNLAVWKKTLKMFPLINPVFISCRMSSEKSKKQF